MNNLHRERYFTQVYQAHAGRPAAERELACLRAQWLPPDGHGLLAPIEAGDRLAGRLAPQLVMLTPEGLGGIGYAADLPALYALSAAGSSEAAELLALWATEQTRARCRAAFSPAVQAGLPDDDFVGGDQIAFPLYRLAGPYLDFDKLLRVGIAGLQTEIAALAADAIDQEARAFYALSSGALDVFSEVAQRQAEAVRAAAAHTVEGADQAHWRALALALEHIAHRPPATYLEAVQLFWLYALLSQVLNYGRLDVCLGDFLANDLAAGRLSEAEAFAITESLWRLINARGNVYNNRVILGGRGRRNPASADRFARLALTVHAQVHDILPQLSLRWHAGMAPELWAQALDVIASGSTGPMLYNDDVNIPAVARAFDVSCDEAEAYLPFGCGEYVLAQHSLGTPNGTLNVAKALDATLHNGRDRAGREHGPALGGLPDFDSFAALQAAFIAQLEHHVALLAEAQATIHTVTGRALAFPLVSVLYDDCLERGRGVLQGGVRYLGGTLETYGNHTAGDALFALRTAVYEQRWVSADQLLAALDANWAGHEALRARLRGLPKFGNDLAAVDAVTLELNHRLLALIREQRTRQPLHSYLAVLINNDMNVGFGRMTPATPDGRAAGESLSNGGQPGVGNDRNGPTALLNSMARLDPGLHAGAVHNLKLSRELFAQHRPAVDALLTGFFDAGGTQLMITVTDHGELEAALEHPEHYAHLIVRVGGYSERFINLPRAVQLEVIARTLY